MAELCAGMVKVSAHLGRPFEPGDANPKAKLTAAEVLRVFVLHGHGMGPTEICKAMDNRVQKSAIAKILNGHRRQRERMAWVFQQEV